MAKNILIFTGAGMSFPLGLPTTSGFAETIKKIDPSLLNLINSYLLSHEKQDIEKILSVLEDFVNRKGFIQHILKVKSNAPHYNFVKNEIDGNMHHAASAINTIKADIFEILEKFDPKKAAQLYSAIFYELKEKLGNDTAFSVFTTNYDLTFESGFAEDDEEREGHGIKEISYGFDEIRNGKTKYSFNKDHSWEPTRVEYKKLHGSLDWTRDRNGDCIRNGTVINPKDPSIMPLLYPGFKGTPKDQPFIDIHEKLEKRLNEANFVFVIGFAFRDEYINGIFTSSLKKNKNLLIFCYNPANQNDLPSDSGIKQLIQSYPNNFYYIQKGVEFTKDPLQLDEIWNTKHINERLQIISNSLLM